jgi:hypothetical protein
MVKGAAEASKMPKFLKDTWAQTQKESTVTWYDIELPPAVGEDVLYNGSTAVAAGKLDPAKFTKQLQDAAASSQAGSG